MKVFILAGGLGTRLGEYTNTIPKPMIKIGGKPLLTHIMNIYLKQGFNDFYVAAGYKSKVIKKYFKNFKQDSKKFSQKIFGKKCTITIVDTGLKTLTGGRLKRLKKFLKNDENFLFTYGDGLSNVNINKLINLHKKNKRLITVTAVRPPARFGELVLRKNLVINFKEKPQVSKAWINGGFFIANEKFLNLIKNDDSILEKSPLEKAARLKKLFAYKHFGFWKCMDVKRDKDELEAIFKKNKFSWKL